MHTTEECEKALTPESMKHLKLPPKLVVHGQPKGKRKINRSRRRATIRKEDKEQLDEEAVDDVSEGKQRELSSLLLNILIHNHGAYINVSVFHLQ